MLQSTTTTATRTTVTVSFLTLILLNILIMSTSSAMAPRIAIIGAGASGLAAARVFSRNGMVPVVFEKDNGSGGVWRYEKGSAIRPMYKGLRTNLPKEIMQYREFPFSQVPSVADWPSFLTHYQVQEYLLLYQETYDLTKFIRYGCRVCNLEILTDTKSMLSPKTETWPKLKVGWNQLQQGTQQTKEEIFDAVCVCNGHYSKPAKAVIPGLMEHFKGRVFQGQRVLCVGGRASGSDLAREIGAFASHVYLSDSICKLAEGEEPETLDNITWVPLTVCVQEDGSVQFEGCTEACAAVDCIILCNGYDYHFPFLQNTDVQSAPGERRVMPLYEQLWHAKFPTLSFPGIPHSVVPFPMAEFQAEAIHAQYVDNQLPSLEERIVAAEREAGSGGSKENGRVPQDTHYLGEGQWEYCRRMAKLAGRHDQQVDDYIETNHVRTKNML
jgi:Flavin-binding monooxygenase-like